MRCLLTRPLKRKPKHLPSIPSIHFPLTEQPNLHKAERPGGQHDSWGAASGVHQAPWKGSSLCWVMGPQGVSGQCHRCTCGPQEEDGTLSAVRRDPLTWAWPLPAWRRAEARVTSMGPQECFTHCNDWEAVGGD